MINNFNFPEGIKWRLRYTSGPDFFSNDFEFIDADSLYYLEGSRTAIPNINISKSTTTYYMFYGCSSLVAIPQLDTSNVTNMSYMFSDCSSLVAIPQLNTSNVTNMTNMIDSCTSLTTIPQLDTSNVASMSYMFYNCSNLRYIPLLDCGKVTNNYAMFNPTYMSVYTYLTDLGGFKNLKVSLDIQKAPNLTVQSLMNVINNLYDFRANGETTTKTLTLGTTNLNKLTDEQKAVAVNKGWNLT